MLAPKGKDIGNYFGNLVVDKLRIRHAGGGRYFRMGRGDKNMQGFRSCSWLVGNRIETRAWITQNRRRFLI